MAQAPLGSSLLGVAITAKSARGGATLIFAYPPTPHPVLRTSKPVYAPTRKTFTTPQAANAYYKSYYDSDGDGANGNGGGGGEGSEGDDDEDRGGGSSSDSDWDEEDPDREANKYLDYSENVLAGLLSPGRELCDQPFELVLDHLAFVGHPVWLGDGEDEEDFHHQGTGGDITRRNEREDEEEQEEERRGRRRERGPPPGGETVITDKTQGLGIEIDPAQGADISRVNSMASVASSLEPPQSHSNSRSSSTPANISRAGSPLANPATIRSLRSPSSAQTLLPSTSYTSATATVSASASTLHSTQSYENENRLTSFNFICIIDTPPDSHLSSHLEGYYKDVVLPLTANIKALEKKVKWLGKEAVKIRKAREGYRERGIRAEHFSRLPTVSSLASALSTLYRNLRDDQFSSINLGGLPVQVLLRGEIQIQDEVDGIVDRQKEKDYVAPTNGDEDGGEKSEEDDDGSKKGKGRKGKGKGEGDVLSPDLAAAGSNPRSRRGSSISQLRPTSLSPSRSPSPYPATSHSPAAALGAHGTGGTRRPGLQQKPAQLFSKMRQRPMVTYQPWETLLLLQDPAVLKKEVKEDGVLYRFLDMYDVQATFSDYEEVLKSEEGGVSLQEIVQHLVHWRKARIMDKLSLKSKYLVSSRFDPRTLPTLSSKFQSAFPQLPPLPILLSRLPSSESFSDTCPPIKAIKPFYKAALIWLLRHDVVEKQRLYVRVVASENVKEGAGRTWGGRLGEGSTTTGTGAGGGMGTGTGTGTESGSNAGEGASSDGGSFVGSLGATGSRVAKRKGSKQDLEDLKNMTIVGSNISNSPPPLSRSFQQLSSSYRRRHQFNHRKGTSMTGTGSGIGTGTTRSSMSDSMANGGIGSGREELVKGPSIILEPGRPSMLESRWISEMVRDKEKSVVDKFEKIIRMLNGAHHLDEIRHRASLSRRELRLILSALKDHLIIFEHP